MHRGFCTAALETRSQYVAEIGRKFSSSCLSLPNGGTDLKFKALGSYLFIFSDGDRQALSGSWGVKERITGKNETNAGVLWQPGKRTSMCLTQAVQLGAGSLRIGLTRGLGRQLVAGCHM